MLYDRLALDLERAQKAVAAGEREAASEQLQHAQAIVLELLSSLQVDAWEGGPRLASLYNWLIGELVQANIKLDTNRISACRQVVEPLRDAWRQAAASLAGSTVMTDRRPFEGAAPQQAPVNWTVVLDHLEGEVLAAEETMARGRADEIAAWGRRSDDWVPPSSLGQIPADLRERAARLLQHQLAVAEALIERITQSQRQRDVAARMSYGPSRPVASYIDRAL